MPARNRAKERARAERRRAENEDALRRHCHKRAAGDQTPHGYYRESGEYAYGCPLCWRAKREAEMVRDLLGDAALDRMRGE